MITGSTQQLVLAVYLSSRGFAFVLFEGPLSPYDWGVHAIHGPRKNANCLRRIERILKFYRPEAIIAQDMTIGGTRRADRIQRLNVVVAELAEAHGVPLYAYSRHHMRHIFRTLPVVTKQTIAEAIVKCIPAFERYLPPQRKPWMSEHARMALFDAAALGLTHFQMQQRGTPES